MADAPSTEATATKRCCACGLDRPACEFYVKKRGVRSGFLESRCKPCKRKQRNDWNAAHPAEYKAHYEKSFAKHYPTVSGRATHMKNNAAQSARRLGVPFLLTREWVLAKLSVGLCEVTGLPFDLKSYGAAQRSNAFAPSLDRIDPVLGYTESNTRVVIWIYNRARGACQDEALSAMSRALVQREKFRG